MNLDELERLHAEIVDNKARGNDVKAGWLRRDLKEHFAENFPALLALARDGERYRWAKDNLFIGYVFQDDVSSMSDLDIDASINAMKERT